MDFSHLTVDCIFVVFSHFSHVELVRYSVVCHEWYDIATTNFLWKDLCTQEFCKTISSKIPDSDHQNYFKHKVEQDKRWNKGKYTTKIHGVHKHSVRGVSFSPKESHLLASSGYDSTVLIFDVNEFPTAKKTFTYMGRATSDDDYDQWHRFARVRWTCDGQSLAVTCSTTGEISMYNAETSTRPYQIYSQSSSTRLDRTAMAAHPTFPYLVAVAGSDLDNREGGNISLIDTRVPNAPVRLMAGVHKSTVRDIEWVKPDEILTASPDGTAKITNLEGHTHTNVAITYRANDNAAYEGCLSATKLGNSVALGCGGCIEIWDFTPGATPVQKESVPVYNNNLPIWRLKYNQRGTLLYAADDDGYVRVFQRWKKVDGSYTHNIIANLLTHSADVSDVDISLDEEYVASASQSREVGLAFLNKEQEDEKEEEEMEEDEMEDGIEEDDFVKV